MNELTFSSYIRLLDSKTVLEHFLHGKSEGVLGESVYLNIEDEFTSDESVTSRWDKLGADLQQVLLQIYLTGFKGYSVSELNDPEDRRNLLKSFFVYEGKRNSQSLLFGFPDFQKNLKSLFSGFFKREISRQNLYKSVSILPDSAAALALVREGKVKRRLDGTLQKGTLEQFSRASVLNSLGSSSTDEILTAFLELLLSTLYKCDIIEYSADGYQIVPDGENLWKEKLVEIPDSLLDNAVRAGILLDCNMVLNLLGEGIVFDADSAQYWGLTQSLQLLSWCGKTAAGHDQWAAGQDTLHPTVSYGHIMPDFSVMIPREIAPASLLEFFLIGEIVSVDVIYKGKISRETVDSSLARGISGKKILEIFKLWNSSPHLLLTVEEWIFSFERVFIDGHYLAMNNKVADHLSLQPEIAAYITPVSDYQFFRISPDKEEVVRSCLQKIGFDTRLSQSDKKAQREQNRSQLDMILPASPVFTPDLSRSEPVQTNFGMYGGSLRSHTLGELLKVIKYTIFMEEQLAVLLKDENEPHIITPLDVKTGDNGTLSGRDDSGNMVNFILTDIDKLGVVSDC